MARLLLVALFAACASAFVLPATSPATAIARSASVSVANLEMAAKVKAKPKKKAAPKKKPVKKVAPKKKAVIKKKVAPKKKAVGGSSFASKQRGNVGSSNFLKIGEIAEAGGGLFGQTFTGNYNGAIFVAWAFVVAKGLGVF
jgi:hypothetical protein